MIKSGDALLACGQPPATGESHVGQRGEEVGRGDVDFAAVLLEQFFKRAHVAYRCQTGWACR
jgi:hypothetical protein